MKPVFSFFKDFFFEAWKGNSYYYGWMSILTMFAMLGAGSYYLQLRDGMIVTGMSDQVSWGFYIANFAFLVGVAAAAVMLIIPSYIFHDKELKDVVLLAEGLAVAACIMCLMFVIVDIGRPDRALHIIFGLNLPTSMLAWDVIVVNGYLFLNLTIPFYILFTKYIGKEPNIKIYFPGVAISIVWAISIHTVTAFLLSSNIARPFWHTAILGPRFLASAFCAGPAFFLLTLQVIRRFSTFPVPQVVITRIAIIATAALQINLFLLLAEFFTEFYHQTEHGASAQYLFFGLGGKSALVPWIWSAIAMNITAVILLTIRKFRENMVTLNIACVLMVFGVWLEKGMGLVVPGFIPSTLGEVFEYSPTWIEISICLGIWSVGMIIYTMLAKAAIGIENGTVRYRK